jgi:adenine-specific DNA-methyltransferase
MAGEPPGASSVTVVTGREELARELMERAERRRVHVSTDLGLAGTRSTEGQFFTPARAAALVASMPTIPSGLVRVLDPGAGSGMLSAAFVARCLAESPATRIEIVAVERDPAVVPALQETLEDCERAARASNAVVTSTVLVGDFIDLSTSLLSHPALSKSDFDLVIQNPPYAKLARSSPQRRALRDSGVEAPNLYAAFIALGLNALRPGGQLVAITPRSFCNGPYFGQFRRHLLERLSLDRLHVFESRSSVFKDTEVLQENVVFSGTLGGTREAVILSVSTGHDDDITARSVPCREVVHPDDAQQFIRIATQDEDIATAERLMALPRSLSDLEVVASTGRVVDFRSRHCLLDQPAGEALPLIYPGNLRDGRVIWPRAIRKPQWFCPTDSRESAMLMPEGWYCVVKRFSAKEERRRVVAATWSPDSQPGPVAFENHINVLHSNGAGLEREMALGLCLWLNSSLVDHFFRTFSGHTQVNATDLRWLRYPSIRVLHRLGDLAPGQLPTQDAVDELVEHILAETDAAA